MHGADGGSGGGGGGADSGAAYLAGSGSLEQGKNGGNGAGSGGANNTGGGGGGAGGSGTAGVSQQAGSGGIGVQYAQFASVGGSPAGWFAGGGAGGKVLTGNSGSVSNGGGGTAGSPGVANTGGGGGGGGPAQSGGAGGAGVVIVHYQISGYTAWVATQSLTGTAGDGSSLDPAFNADPNKDGIQNGMAWILGAGALGDAAANLLKLPAVTRDGTGALVLTFDRLASSAANAPLVVQYGDDLGTTPWTELAVGTSGGTDGRITIAVAMGAGLTGTDYDRITVTIPATYMTAHPKNFVRLMATE